MFQPVGSSEAGGHDDHPAVLHDTLQQRQRSLYSPSAIQKPHRTIDRLLGRHTTRRPVHAGESRELQLQIARELEDERLQALADLLDGSQSSSISAVKLSDFKGYFLPNALPMGVALTGDRVMALAAPADGTFTLYHTPSALPRWPSVVATARGSRLSCHTWNRDKRCTPQVRQRLERWVADLIPRSTESPRESHRVVRLGKGGRANFNPARQELAIWNEHASPETSSSTRTGDKLLTYDLGEINDVVAMCYTPDGEALALGGVDHKIRLRHPRPTALRPTILR